MHDYVGMLPIKNKLVQLYVDLIIILFFHINVFILCQNMYLALLTKLSTVLALKLSALWFKVSDGSAWYHCSWLPACYGLKMPISR